MNRCCLGSAACLFVLLGPSMANAQPGPCASVAPAAAPAPAQRMTVYYCTSKLAGFFPKIGPICHASVVFCPPGEFPAIFEDGQWVSNKMAVLYGYDAGTDSGASYESPDLVTVPRGVVTRFAGFPAIQNGVVVPFGTFRFTRLD